MNILQGFLSSIILAFNDQFGNIDWKDRDRIALMVAKDLPEKVAVDQAYRNAMLNSVAHNARTEHDRALERAVLELLVDDTELFKQYCDNESFRKWLADTVFLQTYKNNGAQGLRGINNSSG